MNVESRYQLPSSFARRKTGLRGLALSAVILLSSVAFDAAKTARAAQQMNSAVTAVHFEK